MFSEKLLKTLKALCEDLVDGLNVTREVNESAGKVEYYLYFWPDETSTACWKFKFCFEDQARKLAVAVKSPESQMADPFLKLPLDWSYFSQMHGFVDASELEQAKMILRFIVPFAEFQQRRRPVSEERQEEQAVGEAIDPKALKMYVKQLLDEVAPYACLGGVMAESVLTLPEDQLQLGGKRLVGTQLKPAQNALLEQLHQQKWLLQVEEPRGYVAYRIDLSRIGDLASFRKAMQSFQEQMNI